MGSRTRDQKVMDLVATYTLWWVLSKGLTITKEFHTCNSQKYVYFYMLTRYKVGGTKALVIMNTQTLLQ